MAEGTCGDLMPIAPRSKAAFIDEIDRQRRLLDRERPVRFVSTVLAYLLAAAFLPVPLVLACLCGNLVTEVLLYYRQRNPASLLDPWAYRQYLLLIFLMEMNFAVVAAALWHQPETFVKAYAIGMMSGALLHVATMRAIHLPMGLAAAAAIVLCTYVGNSLFWILHSDMTGLAMSTVAATITLGYSISALVSTNALHRDANDNRIAAEMADAAKGRFLAQMSHELRTPLNGILGMGHVLERAARDPDQRERLNVIISSAQGLGAILDDILDMTAVREGQLPIYSIAARPDDTICKTVALFRPRAEDLGLTLDLRIAPGLPPVAIFDPNRLRQCISNLLSNSLKHTQRGGISVTVTKAPGTKGIEVLQIEVLDTGPGVNPVLNETIFEPFTKGPETASISGSGLGLSISRSLAQRMGGDLIHDAGHGPGARFVLTITLEPVPEEAPPDKEPDHRALAGMRALVVDDIATNRLVAAAYLTGLGIGSVQVDGGVAALAALSNEAFDLVLLDMNMPEMSGLETFHAIRALKGPEAQIAVVAMTADALEVQRQTYLAEGLTGYVAKPITPDALTRELARIKDQGIRPS